MTSQYMHIFERVGFGILVIEPEELRIVDFNPAACLLLERGPQELIGRSITDLSGGFTRVKDMLLCAGANHDNASNCICIEQDGRWISLNAVQAVLEGMYLLSIADITREISSCMTKMELLEALLSLSPEPMFILDQDHRIVRFFWKGAEEVGLESTKVEGRYIGAVLRSGIPGEMPLAGDGGGREIRFVSSMDLKGGRRAFDTRLAPFINGDTGKTRYLAVCRDITKELQDRDMAERLDKEIDFRKDFISTAAHELRTPLQPLLGYLSILVEDPDSFGLSEEVRGMLQKCLDSVERERYIVERMLELSLLYEGRFRLNLTEVPLRELVSSVIGKSGFGDAAEFNLEVSPDIVITADWDCMHSILMSLISNAVQFSSPPRRVWIYYEENEREHLVSVRDNGIGMEKHSMEHIFEPFHLLDGERLSRGYNRMGLSLSIARNYMNLHGGDITVKSEVGVGSTFTIHLPKGVNDGL
ncbi:MAG: ATP-binding protein [Methanomicrobiales archaeon]|nr:ATP-binding protein [Methanomicrobiales archaeon]